MKLKLAGGSLDVTADADFVYLDVDIGGKTIVIKLGTDDAGNLGQTILRRVHPYKGRFRDPPNPFYDPEPEVSPEEVARLLALQFKFRLSGGALCVFSDEAAVYFEIDAEGQTIAITLSRPDALKLFSVLYGSAMRQREAQYTADSLPLYDDRRSGNF